MRIGIDLGGSKIEAVALADDGSERFRRRVPTPQDDYAGTITAIARLVAEIRRIAVNGVSIGIGIPGTLSPETALVKNANSVCLIGRPFDRDLAAELGQPVRVTNDANCFALSEATDGAATDAGIVFGVILGTGVGGGLVVSGRVLDGPNAIAGEWGHNPLPWPADDERPGPACYCGMKGCIETFLSGPGLERDHRATTGETRGAAEIADLAERGNRAADATLTRYEDRLARALATVINVVDPDVIVLGGGLSNIERLYRTLPGLLPAYVFSDSVRTRVVPPHHGDSSGVRGAAWLWPPTSGP